MKLWVPSLSVAPTGMAPTCRARVSEPSVSTSAAPTVSGIAVFTLPVTGAALSVGASATGVTVRLTVAVAVPPWPSSTV